MQRSQLISVTAWVVVVIGLYAKPVTGVGYAESVDVIGPDGQVRSVKKIPDPEQASGLAARA
jgi:hypothetical protein